MKTLQEEREAIVEEFKGKFTYGVLYSASSDLSSGEGTHFRRDDAVPTINWLRTALLSHEEKVVARCVGVVEDYGKRMGGLHTKMIGTAHTDCKEMLAFDMHSRLIAVKHITEKMKAITLPITDEV